MRWMDEQVLNSEESEPKKEPDIDFSTAEQSYILWSILLMVFCIVFFIFK